MGLGKPTLVRPDGAVDGDRATLAVRRLPRPDDRRPWRRPSTGRPVSAVRTNGPQVVTWSADAVAVSLSTALDRPPSVTKDPSRHADSLSYFVLLFRLAS